MNKRDERNGEGTNSVSSVAAENKMKRHSSRRGFLKKALLSTVAVAGTATLAKKASSLIPEPDYKEAALRESMAGDKVLREREYVVMSSGEKKAFLDTLLEKSRKGS